jgi:hypothetical protein
MSFLRRLFGGAAAAAERDVERRLGILRAEIDVAREQSDVAALERLRSRPAELGLTGDQAELELELLEGLLDAAALRKSLDEGAALPVIPTSHRVVQGERCHLITSASRPDVAGDQGGRVFITDRRLLYLGTPNVSLAWAHVAEVRDEGRDLLLRARTGQVHRFRCNSYGDALRGAVIGVRLASARPTRPGAAAGRTN